MADRPPPATMFFRQTWALCQKTITIVFFRHWLGTLIRAFLAPIIFMFIISYAKNFFVPPSDFGIGSPSPIRSFSDALASAQGGRNTFILVNNGFSNGAISNVIDQLATPARDQGFNVMTIEDSSQLTSICPSSVRGVSNCFGAVIFHSSPSEGQGGIWNYTIRTDGALGANIYVNSNNNDAEIYALPLQHAIDSAIATDSGQTLPDNVQQYIFTSKTQAERDRNINRLYMGTLISILGVAYFIGIVGICYQLTGEIAKDRELGMSQLIEAMMPNRRRWEPQVARLLAVHLSFDILYLPSWVIMGAIVAALNYNQSSYGIPIGYFIMSGLALSSWSIAFASLFKKAMLSGITVVIASIILAIIIQVIPPVSTSAAYVLSLIFPPMNFVMFIMYMAYWQRQYLPADLSQAAPTAPWTMPGYIFFVFSAIQIVAYPIIAAFIERALHGTSSKARHLRYNDNESTETVRVTGLHKLYPPNWWHSNIGNKLSKNPRQTVRAVDNVDFAVLRGQIMVLLGANGSGKSTSLDMLAGLQKPTSGTIEMDATGGIGLCPQKNVLWDELTVLEHAQIFNKLKADKVDSKAALQELVKACDLELKMDAWSKTLSGGQKRKCQLAMMLTGGSKICMLDEVSSGLDPLSRRKIWDIILAERGRRSMILTTHFLDEADLLSDDITVLSKGNLVANGSAVALKHQLGGGYRVRIYHENRKPLPKELDSVSKQTYHDQTVYQLPDSAAAANFVAELEKAGVRDYQVNGPTIEDVFLKLASEVKEELDKDTEEVPSSPISSQDDASPPQEKGLRLTDGKSLSFIKQTWVLFQKRAIILRRNVLPYAAALLIPIIAAGLVTLFLQNFEALTCSSTDQTQSEAPSSLLLTLANGNIPFGPPDESFIPQLQSQFPQIGATFQSVPDLDAFNEYIRVNYSIVTPGGFFAGQQPVIAYRGDYGLFYPLATQNLLDSSLLGTYIATSYQPFDTQWAPSAGKTLQFILYFGLAMSIYPAFFALYTNVERLRNVRALHYSNGIRAGPLWVAYTAFDFIIVLIVSVVTIVIFTGASDALYGPGTLFVVFFLYGLTATLTSYVISLFTTSQLATFAFAAGGQCVFFLLYFIAYMCIITYAGAANIDRDITIANFTIALFFPAGNLLRALLLAFNEFSILCDGREIRSYAGDIMVYGGPILYLILQAVVLLVVLFWYDSGYKPAFLTRRKQHRTQDVEEDEGVDPEVYDEAVRADGCKDDLRVLHASKAFRSNLAVQDISFAVPKGETFALLGPNGAGKSTTIGLIRGDTRPSGRDCDILVRDTSILRHRAAARTNLGVCPQFDAMDQMTAIEHLRFYARARGVANVDHNVDQVVHAVGLAPFKHRMAGKLSGGNKRKLSLGIALMGNPAVVLLDEPSSGMDAASKRVMWRTLGAVSSGRSLVLTTHSMEEADALADRAGIMARRMLAVGTADQLRKKHGDAYHVHLVHKDAPYTTTEDTEEIKSFIRRTFPGAVTEDRVFHGQLRFSVPNDRTAAIDEYDYPDTDTSGGSHTDEKKGGAMTTIAPTHSGHRTGIAALFAELEANKEKLGFEYYSVSQATLDQVFLSIVSKHNVQEENYARAKKRKFAPGWKGGLASLQSGLMSCFSAAF
ncbi:putative ABC transporter [Polychaeton citri CBS 116435]|uniref:ABC transporter n=1 Tax=Polychaeton citri CBS 116435 TaxID=1314669 RepID=A0A9P4Q4F9_9PEZI|nr:putative ABC transporter [Polychaeton citri CBS 116435]